MRNITVASLMILAAASVAGADAFAGGAKSSASPAASQSGAASGVQESRQVPIEQLVGRKVHAAAGNDLGRIEDVLVTRDGNVKAVIAVGGDLEQLGADKKRVAIDWDKISFTPGKELVADVAIGELKAAPDWLQDRAAASGEAASGATGGTQDKTN